VTYRERVEVYRAGGFRRPHLYAALETAAPVLLAIALIATLVATHG